MKNLYEYIIESVTLSDAKNVVDINKILSYYEGVEEIDNKEFENIEKYWESRFKIDKEHQKYGMFQAFLQDDYLLIVFDNVSYGLLNPYAYSHHHRIDGLSFLKNVAKFDPTTYDATKKTFAPLSMWHKELDHLISGSIVSMNLYYTKNSITKMYEKGKFDKGSYNVTKLLPGSEMVPVNQLIEVAKTFIGYQAQTYERFAAWKLNGFVPNKNVMDKIFKIFAKAFAECLSKNMAEIAVNKIKTAERDKKLRDDAAKIFSIELKYTGWRKHDVTITKIENKPTRTGKTYHVISGTTSDNKPVQWNEFFNHDLKVGDKLNINATIFKPATKTTPINRFEKCFINSVNGVDRSKR